MSEGPTRPRAAARPRRTVYEDDRLVPGVDEAIAALRGGGVPGRFVTNTTRVPGSTIAGWLERVRHPRHRRTTSSPRRGWRCPGRASGVSTGSTSTSRRCRAASSPRSRSRPVMVGDDLEAGIGGTQALGMRGFQVRTGKFRADAVEGSTTTPDRILTSAAALPELVVG